MASAAERAADVLLAEPNCGLDPWEVVPVLDALLRHPDLLVDLAVEAGGLVEWWSATSWPEDGHLWVKADVTRGRHG